MVYVDEHGNRLTNVDLNNGYLIDHEWVDHPAQAQKGHYEYTRNASGGVVQTYIVDQNAHGAYREVTVQMFIPYEQTTSERTIRKPSEAYVLKGM